MKRPMPIPSVDHMLSSKVALIVVTLKGKLDCGAIARVQGEDEAAHADPIRGPHALVESRAHHEDPVAWLSALDVCVAARGHRLDVDLAIAAFLKLHRWGHTNLYLQGIVWC